MKSVPHFNLRRPHRIAIGPLAWVWGLTALGLTAPVQALAAEGDLDGEWNASALTVQWRLGNWPAGCGPAPAGGGAPPGATTIHRSGRELAFAGPSAAFTTAQCLDSNDGLERVSHSTGSYNWNTTCRRGAPEEVTVRTRISASLDLIQLDEAGTYRFARNGHSCTASSRKTRTFSRPSTAAPKPEDSTRVLAVLAAPEESDFGLLPGAKPGLKAGHPGGVTAQRGPTTNAEELAHAASLLGSGPLPVAPAEAQPSGETYVLGTRPAVGPDTASSRRRNFLVASTSIALLLAGLGVFQLRRGGSRLGTLGNRPRQPNSL